MAMSNAEKQRRYRERKKEKHDEAASRKEALKPSEDELAPYLNSSFAEFLKARSSSRSLRKLSIGVAPNLRPIWRATILTSKWHQNGRSGQG